MNNSSSLLREKLAGLLQEWQGDGLPSRYAFEFIASDLIEWKRTNRISGLWDTPPTMITATLDDFVGKGIETIGLFAEIAGIKVTPLGVMQSPETIVKECNKQNPSLLGLTVLRTFVFEDLVYIGHKIPPNTLLIVGGGPCLQSDPEIATRAKLHFVAKDVRDFVQFMLNFQPSP
jgi:hypothetical protein